MKKQTDADFLRSWGITDPAVIKRGCKGSLRYQNPREKGIYWYYFGKWVRERDVEKWGTCISCNRPIKYTECDPGHFMPAKDCGRDLLFHPLNVNAECHQCNAWDDTHLLGYAENLDKRYGAGTAQMLRDMRQAHLDNKEVVKDHKAEVYAAMVKELPTYQRCIAEQR